MFIRKSVMALLLAAALLVGGIGVIFLGKLGVTDAVVVSADDYQELERYRKTYKKLDTIKNYVEHTFYIDVDEADLLDGAYRGLMSGLDDPYSAYYNAEEFAEMMSSLTGEYSGVGMTFYGNEDGVLEVVKVFKESPAQKAGMQPGDIILAVDGVQFAGTQSSEAAEKIRGEAGTSVTLTYSRGGVQADVTIVRAKLNAETVDYSMLEDNIGYIIIDQFESKTDKEFEAALNDLTAQGAKGLVIDLRNNGGGLVAQSRNIADMLMG